MSLITNDDKQKVNDHPHGGVPTQIQLKIKKEISKLNDNTISEKELSQCLCKKLVTLTEELGTKMEELKTIKRDISYLEDKK